MDVVMVVLLVVDAMDGASPEPPGLPVSLCVDARRASRVLLVHDLYLRAAGLAGPAMTT
jgi:hypothetical protein